MTPLKPYLIRSVYEWIVDNAFTPYLVVNASKNHGNLSEEYVENGQIILNLRPQAVEALSLGNDLIEFNARFNGKPMLVVVSVNAVTGIYAKENHQGFFFDAEEIDTEPTAEQPKANKPSLRVVK